MVEKPKRGRLNKDDVLAPVARDTMRKLHRVTACRCDESCVRWDPLLRSAYVQHREGCPLVVANRTSGDDTGWRMKNSDAGSRGKRGEEARRATRGDELQGRRQAAREHQRRPLAREVEAARRREETGPEMGAD